LSYASSPTDEWKIEVENAALRARALHELAAAERIYAEASRIRAEAMAASGRALENDSARTRKARSLEQLLGEVRDVVGDEAKPLIAAAPDRLRDRGTGAPAQHEEEEEEAKEQNEIRDRADGAPEQERELWRQLGRGNVADEHQLAECIHRDSVAAAEAVFGIVAVKVDNADAGRRSPVAAMT
jgi:hypothetical protein